MKIIQIMPEFGLAGAEIMCENLTYELRKLGHTVIVLSMYDYHSAITDRLEKTGIDIRYLDKKKGLDFSIIIKMREIFSKEKPDAIHTHRYVMQYAIPAAILSGVKRRVHTIHSIASKENSYIARKLNKTFYKLCGVVPIALSEKIKDSIVKEYRIEQSLIPVIFNGIDLSRCNPKIDYTIKNKCKILHIGRFVAAKNHIGLLEAFKIFHKQYPDSELFLVGEGEKKIEIEQLVHKYGIVECVKFLGLQENVYDFLHDADIFTLPSNYEGIPMTLIEALGTGLPIVATAVGGIPDMLTNGVNSLLVDNNPSTIAKAFETYYLNIDLRKRHGNAAQKHAEIFSSVTMAQKYAKEYTK